MLSIYHGVRPLYRSRKHSLLLAWGALFALLLSGFSPVSQAKSLPGSVVAVPGSSNDSTSTLPPYNKVWGIATHNSYWVNRGDNVDFFASGTQELLSDQLLHEHIRAIEIDIHSEGAPDHEWKVYHTSGSEDFSCNTLTVCLQMLQMFQYAAPGHEVFNIVLELKNVSPVNAFITHDKVNQNFNASHTIQDLDNILQANLGKWLYTPKDFLSRCPGVTVLTDCAKSQGWPTIDQLRGKFMVNVIGNWGTNAQDWADYATTDTPNRAAFPMFSFLDFTGADDPHGVNVGNGLTAEDWSTSSAIQEVFPPKDENQAAFNQSVFWQLEADPSTEQNADKKANELTVLNTFLDNGGVVRGSDARLSGDQQAQVALGIQMPMTDYPWAAFENLAPGGSIPTDPSQRLHAFPSSSNTFPATYQEPGNYLYFSTGDTPSGANGTPGPEKVFAYSTAPAGESTWMETTVSTTRRGNPWERCTNDLLNLVSPAGDLLNLASCEVTDVGRKARDLPDSQGEGCLRAESSDSKEWIELCRQKDDNKRSGDSAPNEEEMSLVIYIGHNGQLVGSPTQLFGDRGFICKNPPLGELGTPCVGNTIGMAINDSGQAGPNRVHVKLYTAYNTDNNGNPQWQVLPVDQSFSVPLIRQGLSASRDIFFAGTNIGMVPDTAAPSCGNPAGVGALSGREVFGTSGYTLTDLSSGTFQPASGTPCVVGVF